MNAVRDDDRDAAPARFELLEPRVLLDASPSAIVAWVDTTGADTEIFVYDGVQTRQITDNSFDDESIDVQGPAVTWQGFDGNDWEIFLYDGNSTVQLTDNNRDDKRPRLDGWQVVWYGHDGVDYEIYRYDGLTTTALTDTRSVPCGVRTLTDRLHPSGTCSSSSAM